jgi:hypothetical protein
MQCHAPLKVRGTFVNAKSIFCTDDCIIDLRDWVYVAEDIKMKNGVVKFAVILTALGAIGAVATYYRNPTELIFSLTIGAGANFLLWFVVGSIFVWVKNKLERSPKSQPGKELPPVAESKPGAPGFKKCSNCSRENLPDVLFCNYCGYKFIKSCLNCGRENLPDASICGYCGVAFQANVAQVTPAINAVDEEKNVKRKLALEQQKITRTSLFITLFIGLILFCIFLGMSGSFKGLQKTFIPLTKTARVVSTPEPTLTLGPTSTPISPEPTTNPTEVARINELNAVQSEVSSCYQQGDYIMVNGIITNTNSKIIENVRIIGKLCGTGGCIMPDCKSPSMNVCEEEQPAWEKIANSQNTHQPGQATLAFQYFEVGNMPSKARIPVLIKIQLPSNTVGGCMILVDNTN